MGPEMVSGARPPGVRFVTGDVRLDWLGGVNRVFLKSDVLVESRKNGTSLGTNSTSLGEVAAHYQRELGQDAISVLGFHTAKAFTARSPRWRPIGRPRR